MLSFLPSPILFVINFFFICIASLSLSLPIILCSIIRIILPFEPIKFFVDGVNQLCFRLWVEHNAFLIALTNKIDWDIQGNDFPKIKGSCIIISNHLSWTDIVMLGHIYRKKIPITKFFLKHSLIYIPFIGLACYSLGMPFLRRYSRNEMLKNPALKHKDIDSTRKACQRLLKYPSSLVNFVEGTRFTKEKAMKAKSPYRYLMPPKAAGLAVALSIIGRHVDCLCNTTILYPYNSGNIFMTLLKGRLKKVIARVEIIEITDEYLGDYINDKHFKFEFTQLLRNLWTQKDNLIHELLLKEGVVKDDETALQDATSTIAQPSLNSVQDPVEKAPVIAERPKDNVEPATERVSAEKTAKKDMTKGL